METRTDELWFLQDSNAFIHKRYVDANWPPDPSALRFLIQARDRKESALTPVAFYDALNVMDEVFEIRAGGRTYQDICHRDGAGNCAGLGPMRFFRWSRTYFEEKVQNDSWSELRLRARCSSSTYPDNGEAVRRDEAFADYETFGTQILSAGAWRMDFLVSGSAQESDRIAWERAVLDHFTSDGFGMAAQRWPHIHLEVWSSSQSLPDEMERAVMGNALFGCLGYLFLVVVCSLMMGNPLRCVRGRRVLGACDFVLVTVAIVAGYGLSCALGIPFTSLQHVLPFVLVGIGVDDAYVIVGAFDSSDVAKPPEERVRDAVQSAGMSVTMTSLTNILAFLCGSAAAFPAVRYFCIYASISVLFIYAFHITAFCAMLALDARRQSQGRLDVLCCWKASDLSDTTFEAKIPGNQVMLRYTKAITSHIVVKVAIIAGFLAFAWVCAQQAIVRMDTNFSIQDLAPDASYMRDFLSTEVDFWGSDSTGLDKTVSLYFRELDVASAKVQAAMAGVEEALLELPCIDKEKGALSWHMFFTRWAKAMKGRRIGSGKSSMLLTQDHFETVDGKDYISGPAFYTILQIWLQMCGIGCHFVPQLRIAQGDNVSSGILASRVSVRQLRQATSKAQSECLVQVEAYNRDVAKAFPGTFAYSPDFPLYHHHLVIRSELMWSVSFCFVAVALVSIAIISHPLAVLLVFGVVLLIFVDLLGMMPLLGVSLNSISMINLVMAIGLVVDYSMHIVHSFMAQDPLLTRDERTLLAMRSMGVSVSKGVLSTLVAILPLALASSELFRIFFRMLLSILVVGGSHGLVLMPVLLSLVGPAGHGQLAGHVSAPAESPRSPGRGDRRRSPHAGPHKEAARGASRSVSWPGDAGTSPRRPPGIVLGKAIYTAAETE